MKNNQFIPNETTDKLIIDKESLKNSRYFCRIESDVITGTFIDSDTVATLKGDTPIEKEYSTVHTTSVSPLSITQNSISLSLKDKVTFTLRVTDLKGRQLNQAIPYTLNAGMHSLPIPAGLAHGVYLLHVEGDAIHEVERFLVK